MEEKSTEYDDPLQMVRRMTEDALPRILRGTGISCRADQIPFDLDQVRTYQNTMAECFGYEGLVLWWIPPKIRFQSCMLKLGPFDGNRSYNVWGSRRFADEPLPRGRWVLWSPVPWCDVTFERGGVVRELGLAAERLYTKPECVRLPNPTELAWLYWAHYHRENRHQPSQDRIGLTTYSYWSFAWTNPFRRLHAVVRWTRNGHLSVPCMEERRLPYLGIGVMPIVTFAR